MARISMTAWRKRLRKTLGRKPELGYVLYEGPSQLDGSPIVAILTGVQSASNNEKTADMLQVWILPRDVSPVEAVKTGDDSSVCGDCRHRPTNGGSCYVKVFHGPRSVWSAYQRGRYSRDFKPEMLEGAIVRFGSWGDPAAVPWRVWAPMVAHCASWTGYTHQWKNLPEQWAGAFMASTDGPGEYWEAKGKGWRCFHVGRIPDAPIRTCPASEEAGYQLTCDACRACNGTALGKLKKRPDIQFLPHGAKAKRFQPAQ